MHTIAAAVAALSLLVTAPAFAQVKVDDAWVRGTVQGQRTTGAFMKLVSLTDTSLVGAASPVAGAVEIHEMRMDGGMMRMRAVERMPLAAGKAVELKPGGYHVMLMGLKRTMTAGEVVPITLTFEDRTGKRTQVELEAAVKPLAQHAPAKHGH